MLSAPNASWGDPIATWDYSSPAAEIPFTDLSSYSELRLAFWGLQHNNAGTDTIIVQVGTAASGYATTGYSFIGNGTVTTAGVTVQNTAQANTIVFNGAFYFFDFNVAARETFIEGFTGIPQGAGGVRAGTRGVAEVNDRIRIIMNSGAASIAAGKVRLYARR